LKSKQLERSMADGLRERRRRQTQVEVANAAIDLVVERGLANVTVDDIAAQAGISRSTFFNHFRSKDDALVFGPPPIRDEALEEFIVRSEMPVRDGVLAVLVDYGRRVEARRPDLERMNLVIQENPHLLARVYRDFVDFHATVSGAVLKRLPGEQVFADAAGAAATAAMYAATQRWLSAAGAVSLDVALSESFAAIQRLFEQDTSRSVAPRKGPR
jgi:AcrR family transcriptional regulator